jgi:Chaperone for flagella basal body P-ring formation
LESGHLLFLFIAATLSSVAPASVCRGPAEKGLPTESKDVVDHYFFDAPLKKDWAVKVDCAHPERPGMISEVDLGPGESHQKAALISAPKLKPETQLIRAGSMVEIWKTGNAQIRLVGTALDSAPIGQSIRVRAGLGNHVLRGIVRGADSVELTGNNEMPWGEP